MPSTLSPQQFVAKWRSSTLKERSAAQEHFIDLCRLVGHETPAEADSAGASFTFEAGAEKLGGGDGFADVWKRGYFAWEYKGKHADLTKAYEQLLKYREALENPPILVVSDMDSIVIHTNFTNTVKRVETLTLDDLLNPARLDLLRAVFFEPEHLRTAKTTAQVTTEAAAHFARLAELLRRYGEEPPQVAHFLIRLLFCLFAEDIGLLPDSLFSKLVASTRLQPKAFTAQLGQLFSALATGGWFGATPIPHVDGGLFDDAPPLELDTNGMEILSRVCALDWSSIEPSIFGTLFERSLDPDKRSQLGAHYTSREDILLVVEPVLMAPWRKRWEEVQQEARALAARRDAETGQRARANRQDELRGLLDGSCAQLAGVNVLDPACGSGNFLYVALRQLLDLWKEVSTLATELGLPAMLHMEGFAPGPAQLHGIEINPYAHELAQATVWIGYLQWRHENGFGFPSPPILKPLHTVARRDAVLAYDGAGTPVEPEWPTVDVIIGNPPFLGGKLLRSGLGDAYVDDLFRVYQGRVPREADYVCYWFEKARAMIEQGMASRAGLLATQGIRGGANRRVLQRMKDTGGIFMAWSDREWVLDGANVNVSIIGFDDGSQTRRALDGRPVPRILSNLTSTVDITRAARLNENAGIAFMGDTKVGAFEVDNSTAQALLAASGNPNGRPNADVIVPWVNGLDITRRPRGMWIVDFGTEMGGESAAKYEAPFEHIRKHVRDYRAEARSGDRTGVAWWRHQRPRPDMRQALAPLPRFIATPTVAKHRLFVWLRAGVLPDHQLIAIARSDDYFMGVLHSRVHELWSLWQGTHLQSRPRYTPTTTFDTFPFPWPPGQEPVEDPRYRAIAEAAKYLMAQREAWLNPPGFSAQDLQQRTLTNLYNRNPAWLQLAHRRLDEAALDAYGWPSDLDDDAILERLLELNLARAEQGAEQE